MSMSTHVYGIRPTDEKWEKMKAIYDSCEKADIEIPDEVIEFFDEGEPDEKGIEVEIPHEDWSNEDCSGLEVKVADIPKNITIIRFYNSW